ncbi:MAG: ribonuclease III [Erysipelothrix sp.]|nr:ribonuclease III [Erysipelothrix sp.]
MSEYNGSVLAYIGDAVLSLQVREHLVRKNISNPKSLLRASIEYVSAKSQANFISYLLENDVLDESEINIYKRGRNYKSSSIAKNADVVSYRMATGLEALWGYLYLENKSERLDVLWKSYIEFVE